MIELGKKVKDKITGFTGVVIQEVKYLDNTTQFCIQPPVDKDGKMPKCQYIDIRQLEVVE